MNRVTKYGSTAAISAALFQMANSGYSSMKTPIGTIPVPVAGALIGVGASVLSDMLHAWLLPHINNDKRLTSVEGALLTPAMGGGGFLLGSYMMNPGALNSNAEIRNLFLVGAASEVLSQWLYQSVLLPVVDESYAA